ncbi:head-tail connector protein [Amycolatopsis sp. cmx-4-68]|uniref:head-tail connector protein n=1 Tax=Amycolatopsis sp. cmx-4-68 TaxID=2790938 RepID=UPI0039787DC3
MTWAPDYATLAELKHFVRVSDTDDDAEIQLALTAASRAVDRATNRQFGKSAAPEDRFYTAVWDRKLGRWVIRIDDLMDVAGLTVHYDTDDSGDYADMIDEYQLRPVNAAADGKPWTEIVVRPSSTVTPGGTENGVEVHGTFGWSAVPVTIKQATLLQASRLLSRRDSPFGVAGSPEAGNEIRLLPKLDPDVALTVRPYYRWWGAA